MTTTASATLLIHQNADLMAYDMTTQDINSSISTTVVISLDPEHSHNNNNNNDQGGGFLLDDTTDFALQLLFLVILSILCGLFGTVTNVINVIIFIKQGLFSGGSTLNLFFLALADFGVVFTNFLHGIGFAVMVSNVPDLPIVPFSIIYLAIGWPHTIFIKINRMLTAYVAFERCMCVVIPFKVKNIFAPKRTLIYLIAIFAYGILSHVPIYLTHRLGDVKQPGTNETKIDLVFGPDREFWHDLVYYGNFLALSFLTVIIVIVCTVVTSAYVRTSKEWRNKASGVSNAKTNNTSNKQSSSTGDDEKGEKKLSKSAIDKEARLVKMITTISALFCICYIPEVALITVRTVDPRINTRAQYERLSHILYAVTFVSATVNSSINIFVYYRMSSKYRQIFLSYFGRNKEKK